MRALGPGSVSSLLKIALDVAFFLLWIVLGALVLALISSFFVPLDNFSATFEDDAGQVRDLALTRSLVACSLVGVIAWIGGFVAIVHRLRRIFATLTAGDPFRPENTRRLREIGLFLSLIVAAQFATQYVGSRIAPGAIEAPGFTQLMTPLFSVLVVFVLAEVFREGARLRRESELTI